MTAVRSPNDAYPTPEPLVLAAIERLHTLPETRLASLNVLDPGAGSGVWGRITQNVYNSKTKLPFPVVANLHGCDLPEVPVPRDFGFTGWYADDFMSYPESERFYDLVVGNPPYSIAEEFVTKALSLCSPQGHVYFLLRLNFLGGQKRRVRFWKKPHLKAVWVLPKRPSFTGDGETDRTEYAMFLFTPQAYSNPTVGFIDWEEKKP